MDRVPIINKLENGNLLVFWETNRKDGLISDETGPSFTSTSKFCEMDDLGIDLTFTFERKLTILTMWIDDPDGASLRNRLRIKTIAYHRGKVGDERPSTEFWQFQWDNLEGIPSAAANDYLGNPILPCDEFDDHPGSPTVVDYMEDTFDEPEESREFDLASLLPSCETGNTPLTIGELFDFHYKDGYASFQLVIEFEPHGEKLALNRMSKLLESGESADVQFNVRREKIVAHSFIIRDASPVFAAMLHPGKFKESRTGIVEIADIEPKVFKELLRYLYTGALSQDEELLEGLLVAADKYQINYLTSQCENALRWRLAVDNVVQRFELAHLYSCSSLLEGATKFILSHQKEVWSLPQWKEINKKYPDLFFSVTQRLINGGGHHRY